MGECGVSHPSLSVICMALDIYPNHDHHFGLMDGEPVEWENTSYVTPAPQITVETEKDARQAMYKAARRIAQERQERRHRSESGEVDLAE